MEHVGTICTHCSNGCKTTLGTRNDQVMRGNNRDRSGINGEFLCVKGRYAFDFMEHEDRLQSPLKKVNGKFEPISWSEALKLAADKLKAAKNVGVIGSNRTSNEENFYLQKFARQGLGTANIDHVRTGDVTTLLDALSGKTDALATADDLYNAKAALVIGSDLSQQHPFLAFQLRANNRHHGAHVYTVTAGPVREDKYSVAQVRSDKGGELNHLEGLREKLKGEANLVILYGDCVKGEGVRKLVAFGDSLGIPVKYVCLVDYVNSRGALDMGLTPDLGPGYHAAEKTGMSLAQMLASKDLDLLWVVGEDPLAKKDLAAANAFVIVQDMFLTATAQRADLVLPSASNYEKNGTVTNVTGEVQKLKRAAKTMGAKPDLEIFGLIAKEMGLNLGIWTPDKVFDEIRKVVRGYNVPLPVVASGGAAQTQPVNGRVTSNVDPAAIQSNNDTLFTSGSLGKYSKILGSVMEAPGGLYK
jgi:NADH-quinone oxidoreductase subunit G